MSTICRLCLRNDEHIKKHNVFDLLLSDTLYQIFGIEISTLDGYSKWICQRCLNNINFVSKLKRFFQINQYLLKERKCPLDYDIEVAELKFDVGTQTHISSNSLSNYELDDRARLSEKTSVVLKNPVIVLEKLDPRKSSEYTKTSNDSFEKLQRRNSQVRLNVGETVDESYSDSMDITRESDKELTDGSDCDENWSPGKSSKKVLKTKSKSDNPEKNSTERVDEFNSISMDIAREIQMEKNKELTNESDCDEIWSPEKSKKRLKRVWKKKLKSHSPRRKSTETVDIARELQIESNKELTDGSDSDENWSPGKSKKRLKHVWRRKSKSHRPEQKSTETVDESTSNSMDITRKLQVESNKELTNGSDCNENWSPGESSKKLERVLKTKSKSDNPEKNSTERVDESNSISMDITRELQMEKNNELTNESDCDEIWSPEKSKKRLKRVWKTKLKSHRPQQKSTDTMDESNSNSMDITRELQIESDKELTDRSDSDENWSPGKSKKRLKRVWRRKSKSHRPEQKSTETVDESISNSMDITRKLQVESHKELTNGSDCDEIWSPGESSKKLEKVLKTKSDNPEKNSTERVDESNNISMDITRELQIESDKELTDISDSDENWSPGKSKKRLKRVWRRKSKSHRPEQKSTETVDESISNSMDITRELQVESNKELTNGSDCDENWSPGESSKKLEKILKTKSKSDNPEKNSTERVDESNSNSMDIMGSNKDLTDGSNCDENWSPGESEKGLRHVRQTKLKSLSPEKESTETLVEYYSDSIDITSELQIESNKEPTDGSNCDENWIPGESISNNNETVSLEIVSSQEFPSNSEENEKCNKVDDANVSIEFVDLVEESSEEEIFIQEINCKVISARCVANKSSRKSKCRKKNNGKRVLGSYLKTFKNLLIFQKHMIGNKVGTKKKKSGKQIDTIIIISDEDDDDICQSRDGTISEKENFVDVVTVTNPTLDVVLFPEIEED